MHYGIAVPTHNCDLIDGKWQNTPRDGPEDLALLRRHVARLLCLSVECAKHEGRHAREDASSAVRPAMLR